MTFTSDETEVPVEAHVIKNNDAEKAGSAPTMQKILHRHATDIFCKQATENLSKADA